MIKHSDSLCTVGETNICGMFTSDDMRKLKLLNPEGIFTCTMYMESWCEYTEPTPEMHDEYFKDKPYLTEKTIGYYFTFPETRRFLDIIKKMVRDQKVVGQEECV